jgi:hypothetical protein
MRTIGTLHPTDQIPGLPDTVYTFVMTGGSSAQSADWLSSGSTAVSQASVAGINVVRFSGMTTAGAGLAFTVNGFTTGAIIPPTSGTSISSGVSVPVVGQGSFQIPGHSTGFSVASLIPGYILAECWHK